MPKAKEQPPLYFWRETEDEGGFLSPWYIAPFYHDHGRKYMSVGHLMMANKAQLFGDEEAFKKIQATEDSEKHRELGGKIKNVDEAVWKDSMSDFHHNDEGYDLALQANYAKFTRPFPSSTDIRDRLLRTAKRELIDASPVDRSWGIGFRAAQAKKHKNRDQWGGNIFGKALMEVRKRILLGQDPSPTAVFDTPGSGYNVYW